MLLVIVGLLCVAVCFIGLWVSAELNEMSEDLKRIRRDTQEAIDRSRARRGQ